MFLHNLRGYDGHLIMSALGVSEAVKNQTISCIPNMTFSRLQFIDSFQFVNSSLDRLSANLQTEDLVMTSRGVSDSELALLRRKGVYPYDYVDSYERFGDQPSTADCASHEEVDVAVEGSCRLSYLIELEGNPPPSPTRRPDPCNLRSSVLRKSSHKAYRL